MVTVPVRGNQMVDLREAGVFDGGHDAVRIPDRARAAIPRIDEQRFAGRRHEERGVAALHVDDIDVQGLRRSGLRGRTHHGQRESQQQRS